MLEFDTYDDEGIAKQVSNLNSIEPFLRAIESHKGKLAIVGFGISGDEYKLNPMAPERDRYQPLDVDLVDAGVLGGELRLYYDLRQSGMQGSRLALDHKCLQKGVFSINDLLSRTDFPYSMKGTKRWICRDKARRLVKNQWCYIAIDCLSGSLDAYGTLLYKIVTEVDIKKTGAVAEFVNLVLDVYAGVAPTQHRLSSDSLNHLGNNQMALLSPSRDDLQTYVTGGGAMEKETPADRRLRLFGTLDGLATYSVSQMLEWKGTCEVRYQKTARLKNLNLGKISRLEIKIYFLILDLMKMELKIKNLF